jgi:hypothetical protein
LRAGTALCAPSISGLSDGPEIERTVRKGRQIISDDLYWSWAATPSVDAPQEDAVGRSAFWTWAGRG